MQKFIHKLLRFILNAQLSAHNKKMENLSAQFQNGSTKTAFHGANELILNSQTEAQKAELDTKVKEIVKSNINNPEKLLEFIQDDGTDVFRLKNADIVLKLFGEEEGFIPPLEGVKAFFINLYVNLAAYKKIVISLKSNEMFILRPLSVNIYYMIHQFHIWYGYKLGLPGFNYKDRKNFKRVFKTLSEQDISGLTLGEIISLKESIARDVEAIDFVVNLSKEYDASKKLVNLIKKGKSVKV